jgi:protein-disulfide isomerase
VPRQRLILLGIALAVAAVAVVAVVVFVGNGNGSSSSPATTSTTGSGNQESAFKGVPQSGLRLGKATAPATLYVFEDPQCPYCREWSLNSVPATVDEFVKTGKINMVLQPIAVIGQDSEPGIRAVYAAANQNKAWNMLEALYQRQGAEQSGWITHGVIKSSAKEAGADPSAVLAALNSAAVTKQWQTIQQRAQQIGVRGTPTFALQRQLGTLQQVSPSSLEPGDFTEALRTALQQ